MLLKKKLQNTFLSCYHIESFTNNTFLWRITKLTCVGDFLVYEFFEFWHQFMCYSDNLTGEHFFACLVLVSWFISIYSIKCHFVNIDKYDK